MTTIVKICGITTPADARAAVAAGADWIGINFWPRSKRFVASVDVAAGIAAAARAEREGVVVVGVFVNQPAADIERAADAADLDFIQLHGDETAGDCARFGERAIKALGLGGADDVARAIEFPVPIVLLDTPSADYGGTGRRFDWSLAAQVVAAGRRALLAGGLDPDNVAASIVEVAPFGVDVASGVEASPGIKDPDKLARFCRAAKGAR